MKMPNVINVYKAPSKCDVVYNFQLKIIFLFCFVSASVLSITNLAKDY